VTQHAGWPFAPSAARSAAELAERVARAVVGPDLPDRQPVVSVSEGGEAIRATAGPPRVQPPGSGPPVIVTGLLREVTRDEVVRALAARMRALARDDRFRLGELR
jgi:hypothetical protein